MRQVRLGLVLVWALMLLLNLALVARYSLSIPFQDEFGYIGQITGETPVTLKLPRAQTL